MFTGAFFWRLLLAVIGVVLVSLVLPPFFRIIGFPLSQDLALILRVVIAAIALFYVITGKPTIA